MCLYMTLPAGLVATLHTAAVGAILKYAPQAAVIGREHHGAAVFIRSAALEGVPVNAVFQHQGAELKTRIIAVFPLPALEVGVEALYVLKIVETHLAVCSVSDGDLPQAEAVFTEVFNSVRGFQQRLEARP